MSPDDAFKALMDRLRGGDQAAAAEVFRHFAGRLIALARVRLEGPVRQKVDPEDVMQSVFKSFFIRYAQRDFDLEDWDGLWALLTLITLRKCGFRARHFRAARRDVRRELPPPDRDSHADWGAIAREPTPAEAAVLADTVEQLLRGLDPTDRRVVELSLQGYKPDEVSAEVGVARRTVYRVLERIKGRLERQGATDR